MIEIHLHFQLTSKMSYVNNTIHKLPPPTKGSPLVACWFRSPYSSFTHLENNLHQRKRELYTSDNVYFHPQKNLANSTLHHVLWRWALCFVCGHYTFCKAHSTFIKPYLPNNGYIVVPSLCDYFNTKIITMRGFTFMRAKLPPWWIGC
jgi:hypothetical protein